jgi:uncharacterized protein YjbI with pentapeptide repeats
MFSTVVIAVAGVLLLIATVIPGVRLWWPQHSDPVSRSDLGIALMTGALIAFAVLGVQLMIQIRSQRDANEREDQADRAALLLQLGRSSNLSGLDLHGQDLSDAYLNEKNLRGANLEHTWMTKASLQDSKLIGANLRSAKLDDARLDRADLRYADLGEASLVRAKLNGVNLDAAALTPDVDLSRADLSNASARADLSFAVLFKANLVGIRLAPANLQGADFTGADLQFADLRGANLRGANLVSAVNLHQAKDLSLVRYDSSTRWPPNFIWPPLTGTEPRCLKKPVCVLPMNTGAVNDFPPALTAMREEIAHAAADRKCLPGWLLEDEPLRIVVYPPGRRAAFYVQTSYAPGYTAKEWVESLGLEKLRLIAGITADGAAKRPAYAFALRSARAESDRILDPATPTPSQRRVRQEVHVWFVRPGGRAFHMWASAPPAQFSLFERDFIRIFGAVGIEGDLFPSLRGGKDTCST